jgi:hypothetical protein
MKLTRILTKCAVAGVLLMSVGSLMAQPGGGGGGFGGGGGGGGFGGGGAGGFGGGGGGFGGGGRGGRGGGNFDPALIQAQQLDRYRQILEVTSDTDWEAMVPFVQKAMDAQQAAMTGRGGGGRGGRGGRGGGGTQQANPERDALQAAIDNNSPPAQIKILLEKYQASEKAKQDKYIAAQADLRKILTVRQEALATLNGLLSAQP